MKYHIDSVLLAEQSLLGALMQEPEKLIEVKATISDAQERMEMAAMYLADELTHIRAGRANTAILDGVKVDSYGSKVPLNQVATVSTPDARTIAIRPWDKKAIKDIEKSLQIRPISMSSLEFFTT